MKTKIIIVFAVFMLMAIIGDRMPLEKEEKEKKMLIKPTIDELDERFPSRYEITILAAKRARDLRKNSAPLTEDPERNPLSQAAIEMGQGIIKAKYPEE